MPCATTVTNGNQTIPPEGLSFKATEDTAFCQDSTDSKTVGPLVVAAVDGCQANAMPKDDPIDLRLP